MASRRLPRAVHGVIERMREIDEELPPGVGVGFFNHMYLEVTGRIEAILAGEDQQLRFRDPRTLAAPLRGARGRSLADPVRAGRHEHPHLARPAARGRRHLRPTRPGAGVDPRRLRGRERRAPQVESGIRRSFLNQVGQAADDRIGPAVHLVSAWSIDEARDQSWTTVQLLWALRDRDWLEAHVRTGLASTVGMASRTLLAPTR